MSETRKIKLANGYEVEIMLKPALLKVLHSKYAIPAEQQISDAVIRDFFLHTVQNAVQKAEANT